MPDEVDSALSFIFSLGKEIFSAMYDSAKDLASILFKVFPEVFKKGFK